MASSPSLSPARRPITATSNASPSNPGRNVSGHGHALTVDSLRWMMRRRLPDCLVNTSVDNDAALGLYGSIGFRRMEELLTVLRFDLRSLR